MADLMDTVERLVSNARPRSIAEAIAALEEAQRMETAALSAFNFASGQHGEDSEVAQKLLSNSVVPAQGAIDEAKAQLTATPARTAADAMRKACALLDGAMDDKTAKALQADLVRAMEKPKDPVVELATRYKRLQTFLASPSHAGTDVEDPAIEDAYEAQTAVIRQLEITTPVTPEGLAALADVAWLYDHGADDPGSEGWEHAVTLNPDARLMARLRHGAHLLAKR